MPDPRHALRRIASARPLSRAVTHLVVVALVAFSAAFGMAATRGPSAANQPFFSIVGAVSAAGGMPVENRVTTVRIDPETADRRLQIERTAQVITATPSPLPTPVAVPVSPPPATPEPARHQAAVAVQPVAPAQGGPTSGGALAWPVPGGVITQYYHTGHLALDIAAPLGSRVIASAAGVVTWAGWRNNGGGYVVQIDHRNGIQTVYNHLNAIWVSVGQSVARGQGIAAVGMTGVATGPHCHFEVIVNGVIVNPLRYL